MEYRIFKDMSAFEQSYVPKDFICREGELREIALCLEPAMEGYQAVSAKIIGEPATGKTTAVKIVLRDLLEKTQRAACAYVSSGIHDTKYSILDGVHEALGMGRTQRNFDSLHRAVFKKVKKEGTSLVVALDDVNFLDSQILNETLLAILKGGEEHGVPASVIAISSSPSFGVRLRSQVSSVFMPREIFFRPYKHEEMHEILRQRCRYGFIPGSVSAEALEKVVEEAHKRHDLRYGISLLRESGIIAEKEGSKVSIEHVEKALRLPMTPSKIRSLSRLEIEIMKFICDRKEATSGELYKHLDKSVATIWRRVKKLEKMKLIEVEKVRGRGRTSRIRCASNFNLEELTR